jgi:hypothetical protein
MLPPLVTVAMDEAARMFVDLGIMRFPAGDRTAGIALLMASCLAGTEPDRVTWCRHLASMT